MDPPRPRRFVDGRAPARQVGPMPEQHGRDDHDHLASELLDSPTKPATGHVHGTTRPQIKLAARTSWPTVWSRVRTAKVEA